MSTQSVCNICGANYEYRNGRWKCPACGAYKAEELSPEEATLFNVAAQKLRFCDFDEAEKAFTDIIEKYPQNPNGYWGRLLSRYGIKYEEDFDGRKIPTCYATSIESVISDKDFIKAIEFADNDTKVYFEQQVQYIERVRKEWVERARKEKPYDIFICYKDSDLANGIDRTQDSIAAQELYIHLTEQGYRVFFSRESLRGKVGEKYEPYIFNALSTAKVMLVYGSKSEYITSTWLKNEWTRYEKRLQAGEKKPNSLIVACDGFSPTELPKVLSSMQCFDATSRSFYTDLDTVLKKIIKGEEKPKPVAEPKPEKKKSKKLPIAIASIAAVIAIFLCILLPNVLGDKPFATLTDSKYGVVISADSEIFDKNTSVIVDKLTDGAQYTSLVSVVNTSKTIDLQNAIIYDIECDVDITKSVTIKVAYTKSDADSTVKVYYVSDDKTTIEEHSCIYDDGYVQFKTTHLSYYVIGEVANTTTPGGSENTGGDDPKPPVTPSLTYEEGVLQVGVSANYEPYEYLDDGQFKGIEIDILKAIATELGLEIRFENDTFEDLLGNLNAKEVDCIIGVTETAQRNELATATNALFSEDDMEFIIYLNKDCNDLRTAINTAITKLQNNGTIASIIESYSTPELPTTTTVIFNANGGSGTMTNQNIEFNSADELNKCEFNREGYSFLGWATTSEGVAIYDDEATLSVQNQESITLYAVWEEIIIPESVKVEFDANGGSGTAQSIITSQNSTFTFPNCNYTKEGYRFVGWVNDLNSNEKHSVGSQGAVGTNALVKYYAKWEAISYTATFKNGNAVIKEVPFTVETTSLVEPSVPARQCYTGTWSNYEIVANDITIYAEYTLVHSNIVKVDAKEAQCNATGNIEYWHCSGCNTNYTTKEGTSEATNVTLSKVACEYVNGSCKWCGTSGSPIEDFTFEDAGDYTYILKSYIGDDRTVVIPAMYQGKPITAIAANAFKNCIAVESVSLSNNITSIGANAFENCTALTNIVFSNKLTTIDEYAFSGCSNLITISIPQTVATIGSAAFKNCTKLDNIIIPSGVQKLQYQVFYGCSSLKTLTISEGVSEIEAYAFRNCSSLKRVIIPQSVTTISPDGIFSGCSSLETLVIPIGRVSYELGGSYISALPCLFGTIEYENAFVYECVPLYYTTNNYGTGYWEDDYWAKRVCYVPNTLKEIYIATTESMGLPFFQNNDKIDIYWNYVYNGVKVDFDYNDGTTESTYKFVESGETYTFDIPTKTGCTFEGWYHNSTKITGSDGVTIDVWNIIGDCTLTAKWTLAPSTIMLNANGGTVESETVTIEYGSNYTIAPAKRPGYIFLGWFGGTESNANVYTDGNGNSLAVWNKTEGATFYAQWQPDFSEGLSYTKLEGWINGKKVYAYEITGIGTCTDTAIKIPSEIDGLHVVGIGANAFSSNTYITSVIFPEEFMDSEGIRSLFANSAGFNSDGLYIKSKAFYGCNNLQSVTLNKVSGIGGNSFGNCSKLYSVEISATTPLKKIDTYAFSNCKALTTFVIPEECTTLGEFVFSGCTSLTVFCEAASKPDGWNNRWNNSNCEVYWGYLQNGYKVELDYDGATGNNSVTYRFVEAGNTYIFPIPTKTGYTFAGWYYRTTQITSASGVTLSVWNISNACTLKAKWDPATNTAYTVKHYQENANDNGYTLKDTETLYGTTDSTVSPSTKTYTGFNAPSKASVKILPDDSAILEYHYTRTTKTVTFVTNGGTAIADMSVKYQQTPVLPDAIRTGFTFGGWFMDDLLSTQFALTSVDSDITVYAWWTEENKPIDFGYNYESSGVRINSYNGTSTTMNIPTYIGGIPVTCIFEYAFISCDIFTSVTIPNNVTSIGDFSFYSCSNLTAISIPDSVLTIGNSAFCACSKLNSVKLSSKITQINNNTFSGTAILSIEIPASVTYVGDYAFYNCTSLKNVVLSDNITFLSGSAFQQCSALESINIPSELDVIQEGSFEGCTSLSSILIPGTVTTIQRRAFYGCIGLKTVVVENGVSVIEESAFYGCDSIEKMTLPFVGRSIDATGPMSTLGYIFGYETAYDSSVTRYTSRSNIGSMEFINERCGGSLGIWQYSCADTFAKREYVYQTHPDVPYYEYYFYLTSYYYFIPKTLQSVTLTQQETLPKQAFRGCDFIKNIQLPDNVKGDLWLGEIDYSFASGDGTEESPYLISSAEQLAFVAVSVNQGVDNFEGKYLQLTTDINLLGLEWSPIGSSHAFKGNFNGSNYTIYGLSVAEQTRYGGLFGYIDGGTVYNLNITKAKIDMPEGYAGIVCGFANNSDTSVVVFRNCHVEGEVTTIGYAGGIVGYCNGTIEKCSSNAKIISNSDSDAGYNNYVTVGGIAGLCTTIRNCFTSGSVSSSGGNLYRHNSYVGGIVGSGGTITDCYTTAIVKAATYSSSYAGGIAGKASTITNCFSVGDISTSTYSLNGTYGGSNIGRIIAHLDDSDVITNCYADSLQVISRKTDSGTVSTNTTNSYGTLQFTQTLQSENFIYNTLGWSSDIWQINEGGFPTLK